MSWVEIVADMR